MNAGAAPVNRLRHVDQRVTGRYADGCSGVTKISISRVTTLSRIIRRLHWINATLLTYILVCARKVQGRLLGLERSK